MIRLATILFLGVFFFGCSAQVNTVQTEEKEVKSPKPPQPPTRAIFNTPDYYCLDVIDLVLKPNLKSSTPKNKVFEVSTVFETKKLHLIRFIQVNEICFLSKKKADIIGIFGSAHKTTKEKHQIKGSKSVMVDTYYYYFETEGVKNNLIFFQFIFNENDVCFDILEGDVSLSH